MATFATPPASETHPGLDPRLGAKAAGFAGGKHHMLIDGKFVSSSSGKTFPVFNPANTTQVGHDEGFCTRLNVKNGVWECLWTTFVDGGQITVQGPYYDHKNSTLSITGGTGAYSGARGEMGLVAKDGGKEYLFQFRLLG